MLNGKKGMFLGWYHDKVPFEQCSRDNCYRNDQLRNWLPHSSNEKASDLDYPEKHRMMSGK